MAYEKDTISENIKKLIGTYFHIEVYEPENVGRMINHIGAERFSAASDEFREIINKRLWSQEFYYNLNAVEFKSEDDFYTYLEEVWQYVFNDGPLPDVEKYWY